MPRQVYYIVVDDDFGNQHFLQAHARKRPHAPEEAGTLFFNVFAAQFILLSSPISFFNHLPRECRHILLIMRSQKALHVRTIGG